ncbi:MAG: YfhO family protein [bacterium]|nr:YfhO family protein [bacterium]
MSQNDKVRLSWRQVLIHGVLLFALLIPAFPSVFFRGELISSADLLFVMPPWDKHAPDEFERPQNKLMFDPVMAFRPDYLLTQKALRNGEWPLWNPLEYAGVPLLANCQSTLFYAPRLLLLFMDLDLAMTCFELLRLWTCGIVAYVCARLIRLSNPASAFFSVAWMFGAYNLLWMHHPLPDVSAWLPVLFVGTEFVLEAKYRRGFAAMALGGVLILFAGHPETAFTFSMGLGFYFLARLALDRRWGPALWKPIAVCAAAWTVVLLVYCIQLFPFIEYLRNSYTFAERRDENLSIPLSAGHAVTFWVPRFFGTDAEYNFWDPGKWNSNISSGQYSGMAVWCGVVLLLAGGAAAGSRTADRHRIAALLFAAAAGTLLAFNFTTLSFVHELPVFSSLHEIYHICFTLFAIPLLGTIGLDRWFSRPRKLRETWWLAPAAAVLVGLVYFVYQFNRGLIDAADVTDYVVQQCVIAAVLGAVAIVLLGVSCFWRRPRVLWIALTALVFVDLLVANRGMVPTLPREYVYPETDLTRFMQDQPAPCRFGVAEAAIYSGSVANYGIEEWLGYDGLFSERPVRFQSTLDKEVWHRMEPVYSVQYYLHDPNPEYEEIFPLARLLEEGALELERTEDGLEVYKNLRAYPRAFLVGDVEVIPDRDTLFDRMLDEDYRPDLVAVTQTAPEGDLPAGGGDRDSLGSAEITQYESTRVRIQVNARQDAALVLSDGFYPGWHATIDDDPVDIFPAYYAFRGVIVPAGEHTVEFRYRPWTLPVGYTISALTLVAALIVSILMLRGDARRARAA